MRFNHTAPRETSLGHLPFLDEPMPIDDWKYADVEFVYPRTTNLVRHIIDKAKLKGGFKRTLIDVKVQNLTPDVVSCIPGWHIDGALPNGEEEPDHHHLCVLFGPQTEFVAEPVEIDLAALPFQMTMAELAAGVPEDVKVRAVQEGTITTFTSYDFHRGVRATAPCQRLLVRLTETNTVLARNKPKAPGVGARKPGG